MLVSRSQMSAGRGRASGPTSESTLVTPDLVFNQVSDGLTFSQRVVAQVTEALSRGQLKPGDRLPTEREMAVQFGVSRTAVRDAVKLLAGQGILEVRRGAGIFIASRDQVANQIAHLLRIRRGSIGELFEVRKVVEVEAAGWAAERSQPAQVERMRSFILQAKNVTDDTAALFTYDDTAALFTYDEAFHVVVAEAAHNTVLCHMMQNLLDLLAAGRQESLRIPGRPAQSVFEHEQVLEAIERRDVAAARREMWRHLDSVERAIIQRLEALGQNWRREVVC